MVQNPGIWGFGLEIFENKCQTFFFFLTAIWLPRSQLWAILKTAALLTQC